MMKTSTVQRALLWPLLILAFSNLALAAAPPIQIAGSVRFLGVPGTSKVLSSVGTASANGAAEGFAYASSISATLPSGNATLEALSDGYFETQLQLQYAYQVSGPTASAVPVVLSGYVFASAPSALLSVANAYVIAGTGYDPALPHLGACSGSGVDCLSGPQSQSGSVSFTVPANTIQWVTMMVGTYSGVPTSPAELRAFADPTISLDPTFGNASEYSIVFSPGIAAAVPEASVVAYTSLGLLLVGYRGWKRRA